MGLGGFEQSRGWRVGRLGLGVPECSLRNEKGAQGFHLITRQIREENERGDSNLCGRCNEFKKIKIKKTRVV